MFRTAEGQSERLTSGQSFSIETTKSLLLNNLKQCTQLIFLNLDSHSFNAPDNVSAKHSHLF